jgi:hypothetical protein
MREFLTRTPDATDEELYARYAQYSSLCYAVLREPTIWSAEVSLAAALLETGKLDFTGVLIVIGGSTNRL